MCGHNLEHHWYSASRARLNYRSEDAELLSIHLNYRSEDAELLSIHLNYRSKDAELLGRFPSTTGLRTRIY